MSDNDTQLDTQRESDLETDRRGELQHDVTGAEPTTPDLDAPMDPESTCPRMTRTRALADVEVERRPAWSGAHG